jgi:rubrerythrin
MQGVITRTQVLAHPIVIIESFGLKVLWRALFAGTGETFLEIVSRAAEEEAHLGMDEIDLVRMVKRFIGFERRLRDVYRQLSEQLSGAPEAATFFSTLAGQEEGHAIVLSRVRREIRKGRLWKHSRDVHFATVDAFEFKFAAFEDEVRRGVTLARALEIVDAIEASEINFVFDTLNGSVDMRSRTRFERFFVISHHHVAFCREQVRRLRAQNARPVASTH